MVIFCLVISITSFTWPNIAKDGGGGGGGGDDDAHVTTCKFLKNEQQSDI